MLRKLLLEKYETDQTHLVKDIFEALKSIEDKLEEEVASKQSIIEGNGEEIRKLRAEVTAKNGEIFNLENKIAECQRNNEGNRQIINKLLNDLDRMQQDIDWYKRTYEKRSFLGMLKESLFRKR